MEVHQPAATHGIDQEQELYSRILRASKAGNVEALRRALDAEPGKVDTPDSNGMSPLFLAVKEGSLPCVKLLVSKQADVNMKDRSTQIGATELDESWALVDYQWSLSPFLLACRLGHQSIAEFLFYNGADVCQTSAEDDLNCLSLAIMYSREETARFLVTHTTYETLLFLMKTVSRDLTLGRQSERSSTPIRQLIQYMPGVAEIVMDRCITLNENRDEVTCYLELLDDFCSPWARQNKDPNVIAKEAFDDNGNLLSDLEPMHTEIKIGQHPLALMQEQECHANLLTHPLSIKLIEHKWRILGSAANSMTLFVYLFFLLFLTGYVLVSPNSFYVKSSNNSTIIWYYEPPDKILPSATYSDASKYIFGGNSWIFVMVLVIFNIIKEIFQIYIKGRSYPDYQRLLEWSIYVLTCALIIPVSHVWYEGYELREKWQWNCGALAIFLAWINLALYVRQTLTFGIYVIMFEDVLCSTLQFLAVLLLFINAFSLAFHMLLQNQTDFHYSTDCFIRTIAMTIGEVDYSEIFHSQNYLRRPTENATYTDEGFTTAVFSNDITRIMFMIFVIAMPIIAMNLLVGVAVEDIHRIRQKATFYYMKLKVDRVITAENTAFRTPLSKYIIRWLPITVQYLKIQLSRRSKLTRFRTWFTSVVDFEKLRESVRAVCKRNLERQELRAQKTSCSHEYQPDDGTDRTLLHKLGQMRDQMQDQMQDQILKINGLISQVEQQTF